MTTEILRNLIYEDLQRLERVSYVVLDEVHYIDDFPRVRSGRRSSSRPLSRSSWSVLSATIALPRDRRVDGGNRGGMETVFHDGAAG